MADYRVRSARSYPDHCYHEEAIARSAGSTRCPPYALARTLFSTNPSEIEIPDARLIGQWMIGMNLQGGCSGHLRSLVSD